jgi:hypothetical protein
MQNRLIARKEEFDKKRDERNLLHQSILNLGNIPKDIIANRGRECPRLVNSYPRLQQQVLVNKEDHNLRLIKLSSITNE